MTGYAGGDERASWALAENFIEQARLMMQNAEKALETFKLGKELNRQRCARRGISATDAEIRWSESTRAKNSIADNSFHVALATMYFNAAAAHYSRASYLRDSGRARL